MKKTSLSILLIFALCSTELLANHYLSNQGNKETRSEQMLEPVFKVAEASEEQGAPVRRPTVSRDILEDASTGATQLFAASVDCEDRFLGVANNIRTITEQEFKQIRDYQPLDMVLDESVMIGFCINQRVNPIIKSPIVKDSSVISAFIAAVVLDNPIREYITIKALSLGETDLTVFYPDGGQKTVLARVTLVREGNSYPADIE